MQLRSHLLTQAANLEGVSWGLPLWLGWGLAGVGLLGLGLVIGRRQGLAVGLRQEPIAQLLTQPILAALPDLIIRMHRDGTYLEIKSTTAFPIKLPNFDLGVNIRSFMPPVEAEQRLAAAAAALKTGKIQVYEFPLVVEGKPLWQEARVVPLPPDEVLVVVRDLTQRHRVEAALRQSQARLSLAQQVAQLGDWEFDLEAQIMTWSTTMFYHWGFDPAQPEPGLAEMLERLHVDDRGPWQQALTAAIAAGTPYALDLRVIDPSGEIRYLDWRCEPLLNPAGQPIKLVGISLEITRRKQTEAALQEREAMLRAIGDNLPKGYIYQIVHQPDKGFFYTYISAGIESLLGLKPEAVLADPGLIRQVGLEADLALADQQVQRSLDTLCPVELQIRNRTVTGEIQWSSIRSVPRRLAGGRTVWDGLEVDITELKRSEAALRSSEEEFRLAFANAPIGISLVAPNGQFLKVNQGYCQLLGYSEAELLSLSFQQITHPADLEADLAGFERLLAGEIDTFQLEKRFLSRQGGVIPVAIDTALVRDSYGQPLYCIGHIQDIRDRRKVERMKDEFISVVSHELRTPLTSIRGALGILGTGVFQDRPAQANHMLDIAISNSDRLVRLVNDILSLERLTSGKVPLVMETCQVAELMQQAVGSVQAIADQAEVALAVVPQAALLQGAPDALIQTLTNLLSNAIKFSTAGSTVWLQARLLTSEEQLRSALTLTALPTHLQQPPLLLFAVTDQGRGIPADKLEVIFEQFQQVDASDSRKKGGTGLGLTICRNIVQQHRGHIWVSSCLGQGSTFYVMLPGVI